MDFKLINPEYLNSVAEGDPGIIREIVELFKEQVDEIYREMKQSLSEKNYHSLGLLAHKAKSSVAIMGITELAALLKTFELNVREGTEPDKYESYIVRFRTDCDTAIVELDDFIESISGK